MFGNQSHTYRADTQVKTGVDINRVLIIGLLAACSILMFLFVKNMAREGKINQILTSTESTQSGVAVYADIPTIRPKSWLRKQEGLAAFWTEVDSHAASDAAKMETHAAMIDRMDQGIGDVITALKETGQFDSTLIVFLSDNGASPEEPTRPGYDRPSETPNGTTIRYTGKFPPEELGRDDTWTGLGPALANACNTPFRFWKKESYHGGCASPFIVHWPAGLKTDEGAKTDVVAHVFDLFPTFLDTAGIMHAHFQPRGKSLIPVLNGDDSSGHDSLYFEHAGGAAHRDGDWKIVRLKPKQPWALYDLSQDRTETTNLAKQQPERVAKMDAGWKKWWNEVTGE